MLHSVTSCMMYHYNMYVELLNVIIHHSVNTWGAYLYDNIPPPESQKNTPDNQLFCGINLFGNHNFFWDVIMISCIKLLGLTHMLCGVNSLQPVTLVVILVSPPWIIMLIWPVRSSVWYDWVGPEGSYYISILGVSDPWFARVLDWGESEPLHVV